MVVACSSESRVRPGLEHKVAGPLAVQAPKSSCSSHVLSPPGPTAAHVGLDFAQGCRARVEGLLSGAGLSGWNLFMLREHFIGKGLIFKSQQALVISKGRRGCLSIQGLLMGRKRQRVFHNVL